MTPVAEAFVADSRSIPLTTVEIGTVRQRGRRDRFLILAAGVLLLAGATRLVHLGYASFCHTESWRANWMFEGGWAEARRFPPANFLMGRAIRYLAGASEFWLRLPYAAAGIASVVIVLRFGRKHIDGATGLIAGLLVAVHPILVFYSRKQLEYSFEAFFSVVMLWLGFEAWRDFSTRRLGHFVIAGLCGLAFSFTTSLWIAAWWPLLAWKGIQRSADGRRQPAFLVRSSIVLLAAGAAWYVWLSGVANREVYTAYYATEEAVWPADYGLVTLAGWLVQSLLHAAGYAVGAFDTWAPLGWVVGTMYGFAMLAAVGVLWRRQRVLLLFAGILLAVSVAAGALRLWPFGAIRHSIYLIPLAMVVAGVGLVELFRRLGLSPASIGLGLICLAVPAVRAVKATVVDPRVHEHVRPALEYIREHRQPGDGLFVYYFTGDAFGFYGREETMPVYVQPKSRRNDTEAFAREFAEFALRHERVWYLSSHDWKGERGRWLAHLRATYLELDGVELDNAAAHLFVRREETGKGPVPRTE